METKEGNYFHYVFLLIFGAMVLWLQFKIIEAVDCTLTLESEEILLGNTNGYGIFFRYELFSEALNFHKNEFIRMS